MVSGVFLPILFMPDRPNYECLARNKCPALKINKWNYTEQCPTKQWTVRRTSRVVVSQGIHPKMHLFAEMATTYKNHTIIARRRFSFIEASELCKKLQ